MAHLLVLSWDWVFKDSVQLAAVVLQSVGHVVVDQFYYRGKFQWFRKTKVTISMDDSNQSIDTSLSTWDSNDFKFIGLLFSSSFNLYLMSKWHYSLES